MTRLGVKDSTIKDMKQLLERIKAKEAKGENVKIGSPELHGDQYFKGYRMVSEEEVNEMLDRTLEENTKTLAKIKMWLVRRDIIFAFECLAQENLE